MAETTPEAAVARPPGRMPSELPGDAPGAWILVLVAGAVLGAVALIPPVLLPDDAAFNYVAVLVAMIAGVYLGFALTDGRTRVAAIEQLGVAVFAVVAVVALSTGDARWLAGGLLGHAVWDGLHHRRGIDTEMPRWYVPLCLGFDVVVGVYVLLRF